MYPLNLFGIPSQQGRHGEPRTVRHVREAVHSDGTDAACAFKCLNCRWDKKLDMMSRYATFAQNPITILILECGIAQVPIVCYRIAWYEDVVDSHGWVVVLLAVLTNWE